MNKRTIIISGVLLLAVFVMVALSKEKHTTTKAIIPSVTLNKVSKANIPAQKLFEEAMNLRKDGELLKAKELYQKILTDYQDYENMESVQDELNNLNIQIISSNAVTPQTVMHEVAVGDSLGKIASKYGTTIDLIKKNNNLSSNVIRVGQKLRIWTAPFNIFVDKSQNVLFLKTGDEILKIYKVSTGKNNSTPVGKFKIVSKLVDPVWFNHGVVVPPESPQNVLGTRWMGFDIPGYGIHGTVEPDAIGQQVTAGCVRLRNQEVEELYDMIPMGTQVVIVD